MVLKITENYESGGAGLAGTVDAYSLFADALCNGGVGVTGKRDSWRKNDPVIYDWIYNRHYAG